MDLAGQCCPCFSAIESISACQQPTAAARALIRLVSQYTNEEEVLIPPLSNLEVIGNPRLRMVKKDGVSLQVRQNIYGCSASCGLRPDTACPHWQALVVPLRVNVNIKSKTIDELVATRKLVVPASSSANASSLARAVRVWANT